MMRHRQKTCLIWLLHAGLLLMAAGVAVSAWTGTRGAMYLTPSSLPARITDDGLVDLRRPLSLAEISGGDAPCTLLVGSDTLTVVPNKPAAVDGVLVYLADCSDSGVRLLCVDDNAGMVLCGTGCLLIVLAALLLLCDPVVCGLRLVRYPWQWLVGILLGGITTVLLLPADPGLPILRTPWLVIHLVPLIAAYALMPVGVWLAIGILMHGQAAGARSGRLLLLMRCMALLLALGIALGAAWASLSWGRFWGWDLKEIWALTALLAASLPLHWRRVARSGPALALSMILLCLLVVATFLALNPFGLPSLHTY